MRGGLRAKRGRCRLAERLPTADSLCSLKVARASKISGRKFSAAARRKPTGLLVCRNGCAEMHRGGPYGLPPRRAPFGRKESQPWAGVPPDAVLSPFARSPHRTPPPPRPTASFPIYEPSRYVPEVEKIARLGVLVLAEPRNLALFSQQWQMGDLLRLLARGDSAVWVGARSEG